MQQDDNAPHGPGKCYKCGETAVAKIEVCPTHAPAGVAYERAGMVLPEHPNPEQERESTVRKCFEQVIARNPRSVVAFTFDAEGNFICTAGGSVNDLIALYNFGGEALNKFLAEARAKEQMGNLNG